MRSGVLIPVVLLGLVAACATNPVTGRRELAFMSEAQEIAIAQESDPQIKEEMGVYNDPELQAYVSDMGLRMAKISERPQLPWRFTVVDVPAVNAFAVPGGGIYITRGILPFSRQRGGTGRRHRTRDRPRDGSPFGSAVHAASVRAGRAPCPWNLCSPGAALRPAVRPGPRCAVHEVRSRRRVAGGSARGALRSHAWLGSRGGASVSFNARAPCRSRGRSAWGAELVVNPSGAAVSRQRYSADSRRAQVGGW